MTTAQWLGGAARWLWENRAEAATLTSLPATLFWLWWNHSYRPPPADPTAFATWQRRERFAFAVWSMPGFRPKWWAKEMDIQAPPSRPPGSLAGVSRRLPYAGATTSDEPPSTQPTGNPKGTP